MSLEPNPELLTTEIECDLLTMLRSYEDKESDVCLIRVICKGSSPDRNEQIGRLIHEIWDAVTACLPGILGHRLSWSSLLFMHSSEDNKSFNESILNVLRQVNTQELESQALFSILDQSIAERETEIDRMGMQLAKLDYWEKHIYSSYYCNGGEVTLVTESYS